MATPAQQPNSASNDAVNKLSPTVDLVSKMIAGVAIAIYACGFLIVSLHNSTYGFSDTNPIRPRILAAGAWFLLLTSIPASIGISFVRGYGDKGFVEYKRFVELVFPLYLSCVSGSFLLGAFFTFSNIGTKRMSWLDWVVIILAMVLVGLAVFTKDSKKVPFILRAGLSLAVVVWFVQASLRSLLIAKQFDHTTIMLWLFGVGVFTISQSNVWKRSSVETRWFQIFVPCLILLLTFAYFYYPALKSAWGGGTPVPVTIYFSKDSPMNPGQKISVQLIDETDSGFYVVGQGEDKAIYIPRNLVSLVYFSDKTSSSKLLP